MKKRQVQRQPSLTIMSMGVALRSSLAGQLWRADLAPLRQRPAESTSVKASLHRIILLYRHMVMNAFG